MRFIHKRWLLIIFLIIFCNCDKNNVIHDITYDIIPQIDEDPRNITIFYTNDEHGWIEKSQHSNGAANIMGLWKDVEGYDSHESYLILSGGDNWLGPPISTNVMGESIVDVMNTMEYDAAVLGNHEFEFGVPNLLNRTEQANFKYLAANIRNKLTGKTPVFATPYIIREINDVIVGIIGLSLRGTQNNTVTDFVKDYEFLDYVTSLEEIVPKVKSDGAELIVLISHISYTELINLAPKLIDMGISVAGGGHCHREMTPQIISNSTGSLAVIQANPYIENYAKVNIVFDIIGKTVIEIEASKHFNEESIPDEDVGRLVTYWKYMTE